MKSSSEAIRISSDTSKKELEELFNKLVRMVEFDFWISVEESPDRNSYWIATPEDEMSEDELLGIIEIDMETEPIIRIIALAHEVGHFLLSQDEDFGSDNHKMFDESLAWYLGYKFFKDNGYIIDIKEYKADARSCLQEYVRSLNENSK